MRVRFYIYVHVYVPECECVYVYMCVFVRVCVYTLHPSASPAIDIQMASCEKLNQEAVEVLALLFLSGRDL